MNRAILISGNDTEVGKTRIITALAAYWLKHRPTESLGLIKLIQTGVGDSQYYNQLFSQSGKQLKILAPLGYDAPLAPPLAAHYEGVTIDLAHLWQTFSALRDSQDFVLAEGLGGLGSPVTRELTVADLAAAWRLPTVIVVNVKLGAIAQTVANIALARQTGVSILGVILNCCTPVTPKQMADWAPIELLRELTQVPILGYFPYLENGNDLASLAQKASLLDLEYLFPLFRYKMLQ
jgi:dethiobiotin synthetase